MLDEAAAWDDWELESNASDDSGGWNDVKSDGSDIELTDSEDEGRGRSSDARKRRKLARAEEKEDSDDEEEKVVEVVVAAPTVPVAKAVAVTNNDDEDEMSLNRANKVLAGTEFADLAMTKVSARLRSIPRHFTDANRILRSSHLPTLPRSTS